MRGQLRAGIATAGVVALVGPTAFGAGAVSALSAAGERAAADSVAVPAIPPTVGAATRDTVADLTTVGAVPVPPGTASAARGPGDLSRAGIAAAAPGRGAGLELAAEHASDRYTDVCHDGGSVPLDLRRFSITEGSDGAYVFEVETCQEWETADLEPGEFVWTVGVPDGRTSGADYAVRTFVDDGGALGVKVVRTPTDDPDDWTTTFTGSASRPDEFSVAARIPIAALGSPNEIILAVFAHDGRHDEFVDSLPESYADVLEYPYSCQLRTRERAVVTLDPTDPGAADRLVEKIRDAGIDIRRQADDLLALRDVTDAQLAALGAQPGAVEVRHPVSLRSTRVPNDPAYSKQWALPTIDAPRAWDVRSASGLTLAIVDDGVDGQRPELAGRVLSGRDTVHDRALPAGEDSDLGGHGTNVAGIAAAAADNGIQLAGVDWGARLLPYRVFDASGCADDVSVALAIRHAADRDASVINISLSGTHGSERLREAVDYALARGSLVVAAAGNDGEHDSPASYPAAYDPVVAVGATTRQGSVASYSTRGDYVDLVAPGGDASGVPTTDILLLGEHDGLVAKAGTSFAAPEVAAAALLFRSLHPQLSPGQVASALRLTVADAGPAGPDASYGAGVLDLAALLTYDPPRAVARSRTRACPPGAVPEDRFADLPASNVHEASVDCVVWWDVAAGAPDGYHPAEGVTRGQLATFLSRLLAATGGALPTGPPDAFGDDEASVHEAAINVLAAADIINGYADGTYRPHGVVRRDQMATYLVRTYAYRAQTPLPRSGDYFGDDDRNVHEPAIDRAAAAGFTVGAGDNVYGPAAPVRRDQMASFLARALDALVEAGYTAPPST